MSIITDIFKFLKGTPKKVKAWLDFGKNVANTAKQYADNPLLDIAVGLTATKLDDIALKVVRITLSTFIKKVGWAELKLSELDGDARAVVLSVISAVAAKTISDVQDGNLNIQTALTAVQYNYDPEKIKV